MELWAKREEINARGGQERQESEGEDDEYRWEERAGDGGGSSLSVRNLHPFGGRGGSMVDERWVPTTRARVIVHSRSAPAIRLPHHHIGRANENPFGPHAPAADIDQPVVEINAPNGIAADLANLPAAVEISNLSSVAINGGNNNGHVPVVKEGGQVGAVGAKNRGRIRPASATMDACVPKESSFRSQGTLRPASASFHRSHFKPTQGAKVGLRPQNIRGKVFSKTMESLDSGSKKGLVAVAQSVTRLTAASKARMARNPMQEFVEKLNRGLPPEEDAASEKPWKEDGGGSSGKINSRKKWGRPRVVSGAIGQLAKKWAEDNPQPKVSVVANVEPEEEDAPKKPTRSLKKLLRKYRR